MRERLPDYGDTDYRGSEEVEGDFRIVTLGQAVRGAADLLLEEMRIAPSCESPIEVQLGAWLRRDLAKSFEVRPQYWLERFRMDFAVLKNGAPALFIECDGKEFHSTLEQQANDRAKDAACVRARIPLLRFTGSAIFRHPQECCRQIVSLLEGLA